MVSISIILYSFSLNLSLPFQFLGVFLGGFVWISEIGADSMFDFNFRILSVDKKLKIIFYIFSFFLSLTDLSFLGFGLVDLCSIILFFGGVDLIQCKFLLAML